MSDASQFVYAKLPNGNYAKFKAGTTPAQMRQMLQQKGLLPSSPAEEKATISAPAAPANKGEAAARWIDDAMGDFRYGGERTAFGRVLKKMGAQPLYSGTTPSTAEFIESVPLGAMRAAKGLAEGGPVSWKGIKDELAGILQGSSIPAMFVAPEISETAQAVTPAGRIASAGKIFDYVDRVAGKRPVNTDEAASAALRAFELHQRGLGNLPSVISKFLDRIAEPGAKPMTYSEARDFYNAATSKLSPEEINTLKPKMLRELSKFTASHGKAIQETADQAGVGAQHAKAMSDFSDAMKYASRVNKAKKMAKTAAATAALSGTGAYTAKKIWNAGDRR